MEIKKYFEILKKTPTSVVTDAMRRVGISGYPRGLYLLQDGIKETMVGRAVTMGYLPKQPGLLPLQVGQFDAAKSCNPGDILVFAALGTKNWVTGGNVGMMAMMQGATGMIIDGCIRDSVELKERALPVYCCGTGTKPYNEDIQLAVFNEPVDFAGIRINPGDIIIGDEDGLVVIPFERLNDVMYQLEDIPDIEDRMASAIARGDSVEDISKLFKVKLAKRL